MSESSLPRRSLLFGLLAAPLTVAACSGGTPKSAASSGASHGTPSSTSATTPPTKVTGAGLPADLLAVMTSVYLGGKVPATAAASAVLAKRTPGSVALAVTGGVGTWQGVPIAVVAHQNDVTLLVKDSSWKVVGGWWPSLKAAMVPTAPTRILAVGSDARPNQTPDKCRADALHIIGVDARGVGGIVGIPRDSYVPLSTGGTDKINAALVFGGTNGIVRTIENTTGVKIDGYMLTGFKGFRAILDGVGGIPYVSKVMLKSDGGTLLVKVGRNLLDSSTGLGLARERHSLPNGDFGRSANQNAILLAAMAVAKAKGPAGLPKLLTVIGANVKTDISATMALNLASSVFRTTAAVPNQVAQGGVATKGGASVVVLDSSAKALFADMANARLGG
ncbi:LCP family protein required for cell wall assembly [Phycicoccus badiiscoriae]|uniref:LCP family protein required for cell wall assembly n=1 Tax=Pedococcus badiiscoriae TaxID=642776 RepID=A0A852WG75_9MICO|nr:LCP family protein required for cell wall assembly [Pedococcus badiiscoriae]